jgi:hypothetical protein
MDPTHVRTWLEGVVVGSAGAPLKRWPLLLTYRATYGPADESPDDDPGWIDHDVFFGLVEEVQR